MARLTAFVWGPLKAAVPQRHRCPKTQPISAYSSSRARVQAKEKEMLVADLRPSPAAAPPATRVVPVPDILPTAPATPAGAGALASQASSNGIGSLLPEPVRQVVAVQSSSTKTLQAELGLTREQVKQQALELKDTKAALAQKEREVNELHAALAERDGKLKTARADALESKMALVAKDAELVEAYRQLSQSVQQRSQLRSELAQNQTELAETRAELEQLADDILSIRELMDTDLEGLEGWGSLDINDGAGGLLPASAGISSRGASAAPAAAVTISSNGSGGAAETGWEAGKDSASDEGVLDALQTLSELSRQLAEDAAEDDAITARAAQLERGMGAVLLE